jgi:hypothetical protein
MIGLVVQVSHFDVVVRDGGCFAVEGGRVGGVAVIWRRCARTARSRRWVSGFWSRW